MKNIRNIIPLLLICFLSTVILSRADEISEDKLKKVSLGMKEEEVISILGQPNAKRADGANAEGKAVERLEYSISKPMDSSNEGSREGQGHETAYSCSLVIVSGALQRIERLKESDEPQESESHRKGHRHTQDMPSFYEKN